MDAPVNGLKLTPEQRCEELRNLHSYFGRHVVCLALQYVGLDANGKPVGKEHFLAISGFIMSLRGLWFLVTAGHALEELDKRVKQREIEITCCRIADYFGKDAKVLQPIPFTYDADTPKGYIHNEAIGLDVGLIYMRDFFRRSLVANGIKAITEADWMNLHAVTFEAFVVLGFPKELVDKGTQSVEQGKSITASVPMVAIPVEYVQDMLSIPDTVQLPQSELPWFIGRVIPENIPSMEGMSGGPLIGMANTPEGTKYWVVALQSGWYEKSRIIVACPLPVVATIIDELFKEHGIPDDVARLSSDSDP